MKRLYINCDSGVSGDMLLGAFINMGVPEKYLREGLARLALDEFELQFGEKVVDGRSAGDVDVILKNPQALAVDPYSGNFRNYKQIVDMIYDSTLDGRVKALSHKIFEIKARAEAKVHRVPIEDVRFHEAGAVDSIVDIVGSAICCDYVGVDRVASRAVPTGYGTVSCACGVLPVPAPAVRQILRDNQIPHYRSEINQEVLTPTGASILAGVTDEYGWETVRGEVLNRGYGSGKRDTGLPPLELILCEERDDV